MEVDFFWPIYLSLKAYNMLHLNYQQLLGHISLECPNLFSKYNASK